MNFEESSRADLTWQKFSEKKNKLKERKLIEWAELTESE